MKKTLIIMSFFFLMAPLASAHPGRTDSSGCHTCRTNCSSWGLYTGQYHCHNAKTAPQPQDPIKSTYGAGGTGYTSPAPEYRAPSRPSCPSMATYNSLHDRCECYSGYVAETDYSGNQTCVSGNSKCQKEYGYGSRYDSLSESCECNYGYIMSAGKCVSEMDYCSDLLGFNSKYNSLYEKCECNYGYILHNGKCISEDAYCEDMLGRNSKYDSLGDKCECDFGYVFDGSDCVIEKDEPSLDFSGSYRNDENVTSDISVDKESAQIEKIPNGIISENIMGIQEDNGAEELGFKEEIFKFFRMLKFW